MTGVGCAEGRAAPNSAATQPPSRKPALCVVHVDGAVLHLAAGEGRPEIGGAEVQLMHIVRGLLARGWAVRFVVPDVGQAAHIVTDEGVELFAAYRPRTGPPLVRFLTRTVRGLWRAMAKADADVYLLRGATWMTALLALFCRARRRRWVFWLASVGDAVLDGPGASLVPPGQRWLYRYGLRRADAIVCQTQEQADLLKRNYGLDAAVTPNIWPVSDGAPPEKAEPPEVLWAGRVMPMKRPQMLLDVAERLPDVRFALVGGPGWGHDALFDEVRARAEGMANVEVYGFVPFGEIDAYYRRASVLLCTSTVEGFPNTFLQAWASHVPVVSTYDPDDVLRRRGLGFQCATVDEIADKVSLLCSDPSLRREIGQRCFDHLATDHAAEVVLPRIERAFSSLAASAGEAARA